MKGRTIQTRMPREAAFVPVRRILPTVLVALLLALSLAPATAFAADNATITVGSASEAIKPGGTFTVPVSIASNPGFAGAALVFSYDDNALELTGFDSKGALFDGGALENAPQSTIGYFGLTTARTGDGTLFVATFKVKPTAAEGDYQLSLGLVDNSAENFVNAEANVVPVTFTAGAVTVSKDGTTVGTGPGDTSNPGGADVGAPGTGSGAGTGLPVANGPDVDGDGLSDADEVKLGTNQNRADSDGDGYTDGEEVFAGSDPLDKTITPGSVALSAGLGTSGIDDGTGTGVGADRGADTTIGLSLMALIPWLISGLALIAILIGLFLFLSDRRRQQQREGVGT